MRPVSYPLFLSVVLLVNISLAANAQSSTACIDSSLINKSAVCPDIVAPVCGCNGVTYSNSCIAENYYGVTSWTLGACNSSGAACKASFTYCAEALGSIGITFQFTNTSISGYTSLLWTFSDGDTSTLPDPLHTFVNAAAIYTACLTINSIGATPGTVACTNTVCDTLSTTSPPCSSNQPCQASFIDSVDPVPVPYGYIDIAFVNTSKGAYTNSVWSFGDGSSSTAQNPTHIFKTTTPFYIVCLTISDSANTCQSTICDTVIMPNPTGPCQASFRDSIVLAPVAVGLIDIAFVNTSTGTYTSSLWTFGDGDSSTAQNPSHLYKSTSPYYIACLTISNSSTNCSSTVCDTIHIPHTTPCIDSSLINDIIPCPAIYAPVCGCNGITYSNSCEAEYHHGVTSWTPGACNSSGSCQASFISELILVATATGGLDVHFINTSKGIYTHVLWTFGDGDSSTAQDPTHEYLFYKPYYIVCLTISDSLDSCNSTVCDTLRLIEPPKCVDTSLIDHHAVCPDIVFPVCGCNGVTYVNSCVAEKYFGVTSWTLGPCGGGHIWPGPVVVGGAGHRGGLGIPTPGASSGRLADITSVSEETLNLALYPNPAGDQTNIAYNLNEPANVAIDVVDMLGRSISSVFNGDQSAGQQLLTLSIGTLSNGIYLVRVNISGQVFTKQLSIVH